MAEPLFGGGRSRRAVGPAPPVHRRREPRGGSGRCTSPPWSGRRCRPGRRSGLITLFVDVVPESKGDRLRSGALHRGVVEVPEGGHRGVRERGSETVPDTGMAPPAVDQDGRAARVHSFMIRRRSRCRFRRGGQQARIEPGPHASPPCRMPVDAYPAAPCERCRTRKKGCSRGCPETPAGRGDPPLAAGGADQFSSIL